MTRTHLTALLPALALGLAAPALAETAVLKFDDLDLSTEAGQAKLEARTRALARKLCDDGGSTGTRLPDTSERDACVASVRRQIAQQVAAREAAGNRGG